MTELTNLFAKIFDNLNAGRIIFYIASGMPGTSIFLMIANTLVKEKGKEISVSKSLLEDFLPVSNDKLMFLFFSYIFGFMISIAAYPLIYKLQKLYSKGYSITRNLKVLCDGKRDYIDTLLIPEYYRYVEAAVFIPVGVLIGIYGSLIYALINLFIRGKDWNSVFLATLLAAIISQIAYYIWYKKIICFIVNFYEEAKAGIINGLGGKSNE
jgi:hypothetical protein